MATTNDMEEIVMGCCGVVMWLPKNFLNQRREDKKTFYCPSGHARAYKRSISALLREQLTETQKGLGVMKAALEGVRQGKCPHCGKTVKDLSGHIRRKHT